MMPAQAQPEDKPFILPMGGTPGPNTWLFGQAYGNTTGAYNFGSEWYEAGQGLHFGLDFPAPCGTPLVAVADGMVVGVDDLSRGAGPHNLLIRHDEQGVVTLYGHLLRPAELAFGQIVRQGDIIGLSGDPDRTCDSRPHLHFEVRSLDYRTAYNPVDYITANWHTLASVGGYGFPYFQQDMNNARRWMTLEDQPETVFGGRRLNDYGAVWPLPFDLRPPANPPLARDLPPLDPAATWTTRQLGFGQCCWGHWWDATNPDRLYVIDGGPGERAGVFAWSATGTTQPTRLYDAPPAITSPDGTHLIYNNSGQARIVNTTDNTEWITPLLGATPALSPDNSRLTWTTTAGSTIPGQARPISTVWLADADGYSTRQLASETGLSGRWLDDDRLLFTRRLAGQATQISIYDLRDDTQTILGTFENLRNLTVSPGGDYLMFYLLWQADPTTSGVYLLVTTDSAQPQKMDWFGAWRWRDNDSLYFLPFDPAQNVHRLAYYDLSTGTQALLETPPFTVMNGDWNISADGRRIVFHNALDRNMWLLELTDSSG